MSDDEPQFTSLKERIAALKLQNGGPSAGASTAPSAPVPAARKWIPADSNHTAADEPAPTPLRKVPSRPAVPPRQAEPDEEVLDSNGPPSRRHYSATRFTPKPKPPPAQAYQRLVPPPPTFDDDDTEDSHTPPLPHRRPSSSPSLPRRASAASTVSTHSDTAPPPLARRPSDAPPAAVKRTAPPTPGSKRPALPASVFIKGGAKPKTAPVGTPEAEPEPEPDHFSVNGRRMPPTISGLKPATTANAKYHVPQSEGEEEEAPAASSVAARIAAMGRQMPVVPGGRPPLPTRTSGLSEDNQSVKKTPVPTAGRPPPLPSAARPPLPASQRPTLSARQTPQPEEEGNKEEEEPAPTSIPSRAAAIGRRLPPSAPAGKPPPLPISNADNEPAAVSAVRTGPPPIPSNRPPPVPLTSRPRAAHSAPAVDVSPVHPIDYATAPKGSSCLMCRDFSEPDQLAAQYPLASLPRHDTVAYLAAALCMPFPSPTDKARAIFTWCHHNIAYDVDGFFGGCIPRGQSTKDQIFSGKAVCEGYANIFSSIAEHAGLEVVKVSGHGKGFGFNGFQPGDKLPEITGHAWNAVRIDGGEWKLVDSCWGAGAVKPGQYVKRFEPFHFNASNEVFGLRHYPGDRQSFFRSDGETPTWEAYLLGPTNGAEVPQFYGNGYEEGFDKASLQPEIRSIDVASYNGGYIRFLVSHICEHWDGATNGPGPKYPIILNITPVHGNKDTRALETDGYYYWVDVLADDLGTGGGEVFISLVTQINGESARGKGNDYFLKMKGRSSMSWTHVASWNLA